jgi:hypothetical protein
VIRGHIGISQPTIHRMLRTVFGEPGAPRSDTD